MVNLWLENILGHPTSPVQVPAVCTVMSRHYMTEVNLLIHGVFEAIAATKFVKLNLSLDLPWSTHLLVLYTNVTIRLRPFLLLPNLLLGRVVKLVPVLDDQIQP